MMLQPCRASGAKQKPVHLIILHDHYCDWIHVIHSKLFLHTNVATLLMDSTQMNRNRISYHLCMFTLITECFYRQLSFTQHRETHQVFWSSVGSGVGSWLVSGCSGFVAPSQLLALCNRNLQVWSVRTK